MIRPWLVRLELARDDDESLSDVEVGDLTRVLTDTQMSLVLGRGGSGAVRVQMTVRATNDQAARSAAERLLRDRAQEVWAAHGLPPFTITFLEAKPDGDVDV